MTADSNLTASLNWTKFSTILGLAVDVDAPQGSDPLVALPNVQPTEDLKAILIDLSQMRFFGSPSRVRIIETDLNPPPYETKPRGRVLYNPKVFVRMVGMTPSFDGSGLIISGGNAYTFHMCDHEWDRSGADPRRGWHPAVCRKCRVNASIDSGD